MYVLLYLFCVYCNAYHRYLHVLTHSFPTRRSPDLGHDASHSNAGGQVAVAFGLELGNQGSGGNVGWFPAEGPSRTLDTNRSEEHTSELQSLMGISYAVL